MATDETTSRSQPEAVLQQPGEAEATIRAVPATFVGMPPTAQTFYAVVNAGGTVARGFGVVSATAFGGGNYEVIFSHDVTGSAGIVNLMVIAELFPLDSK